jgi:acyl carrier protein
VNLESTFEELGADQLDVASIMVDIETVFGVPIPDADDRSFDTAGQLAAFLDEYFRRADLQRSRSDETA